MELRCARPADRPALDELWHICFGDEQGFRDWFFGSRFLPDSCLTAWEGEQAIGAVYGLPMHFYIRGRVLPCVIIGGVSTHPDHWGKGVMRRLFTRTMADLYARGVPCTFLHPVTQELYFSFGHYTSCDRGFLTLPAGSDFPPRPEVIDLLPGRDLDRLYRCYQQHSRRYSGLVCRSWPDFAFKYGDYRASDAVVAALPRPDGGLDGYCICYRDEKELLGEEFVALTPEAARALAAGMAHRAKGRKMVLKLPHDMLPDLPGADALVKPWGAMGVAHLPSLLAALAPASGFALEVRDHVVPGNNGVFDLTGRPTDAPPQVSLEAGRLMQWLVGYRSLAQLAAEGNALIRDAAAAARLEELLPPVPCSCSDEY